MQKPQTHTPAAWQRRQSERGAALISTLLISMMLLTAGGALILTTTMSATNAYDSTSEMQAYYAAEAGLQATLNVLRNNSTSISPTTLTMDFRKAITTTSNSSNRTGDPQSTAGVARLSNWLTYDDYTNANARVVINSTSSAYSAFSITVTDPDNIATPALPSRLLVVSKGYGPRGAVKQLKTIISQGAFIFQPPSTLTMVAASDPVANPMHFTLGNSNAETYSGHDNASGSSQVLPAFGTTSASDLALAVAADTKNTVATPKAANLASSSLPSWLQSADAARAFLNDMQARAQLEGRYVTSLSGSSGTTSTPAFTFVDGDATLTGGAGLLIVTGNLTMSGNPSFNGLILVLGGGTVNRNGGGNGNIYGAMVVADFPRTGNGSFNAPWFDTSGGGNSTIQYDSSAVSKALTTSECRSLGVIEY